MAQKRKNTKISAVKEVKIVINKVQFNKKKKRDKADDKVIKPKQLLSDFKLVKKKRKRENKQAKIRIVKDGSLARSRHLIDLKDIRKQTLAKAAGREPLVGQSFFQPARLGRRLITRRRDDAPEFIRRRLSVNLDPLINFYRAMFRRFKFRAAVCPAGPGAKAKKKGLTKSVDSHLIRFVQWLGFFLWKVYKWLPRAVQRILFLIARFLENIGRAAERAWLWLAAGPRPIREPKLKSKPRSVLPARPGRPMIIWHRSVIGFFVVCFLLVLPIRALSYYLEVSQVGQEVIGIAQTAFNRLKAGGESSMNFDLIGAEREFNRAWQGFNFAEEQLDRINGAILSILKLAPRQGRALSAGEKLLAAGKDISLAGRYLAAGLEPLAPAGEVDWATEIILPAGAAKQTALYLTDKIINLKENFILAGQKIDSAQSNLSAVKTGALPAEYRDDLAQARAGLLAVQKKSHSFVPFVDFLAEILGHRQTKRYLLIFQNNAELRATGGFIGSLGLVDIDRGQIKNMEIPGGGPYDLKAGFFENVISPEPLRLVNPRWEIQDANWFPDWPASARKIMWFYGKAGGPSVDGVIALTPSLIKELIALTGPIDMTADYGAVIDADNFVQFTQTESEKKYEETKTSKQFIADLAPLVLSQALAGQGGDYLKVLAALSRALGDKSLLFYFQDDDLERKIIDYGWGGQIKQTDGDYLAIVHSNVGGGKTDTAMTEKIDHLVEIDDNGAVIDTLTITRTHNGVKDDPFTGYKNVDYLRVYVPLGSELIAADGFEEPWEKLFLEVPDNFRPDDDLTRITGEIKIDGQSGARINREFGKTVFGNWVQTDIGQTSVVSIKYRLPFKINLAGLGRPKTWRDDVKIKLGMPEKTAVYGFLVQKQPGASANQFNQLVKFDFTPQVVWQYPDYQRVNGGWQTTTEIDGDKAFGIVFKK